MKAAKKNVLHVLLMKFVAIADSTAETVWEKAIGAITVILAEVAQG